MKCSREGCTNEGDDFIHVQLKGNYCRECAHWISKAHLTWTLENGPLFILGKTREDCERDRDSLYMLKHPELWGIRVESKVRVICVKHGTNFGSMKHGVIVEGDGPKIYLRELFSISDETVEYDSWEELVKAGWEVD